MKFLILLPLFLICHAEAMSQKEIAAMVENLKKSVPAVQSISHYKIKGKSYFATSSGCCDIASVLYDEKGEFYCSFGGGLTNYVDKKCYEFITKSKFIKTLWELNEKPANARTGLAASGDSSKPEVKPKTLVEKINILVPEVIKISKYTYKGKTYYLSNSDCCDIPNTLFDETGARYCAIGGGFANFTDKKCLDFEKKAKLEEVILDKPPRSEEKR